MSRGSRPEVFWWLFLFVSMCYSYHCTKSSVVWSHLCHFLSPSPPQNKKKKNSPPKKFLIFLEMKLSSCNIKKNYIFSKQNFSYISGNGTLHFPAQVISIDVTIVFRVFSFHELSLPWLYFVRYFVCVLLYRECYGFERAVFTLRYFYFTLLPNIWHNQLLSRLPLDQQFCLEGCRASHWGLKPGSSVFLNHTVFSKSY